MVFTGSKVLEIFQETLLLHFYFMRYKIQRLGLDLFSVHSLGSGRQAFVSNFLRDLPEWHLHLVITRKARLEAPPFAEGL